MIIFCEHQDYPIIGAYQYKGCGRSDVYLVSGYELVKDEDDICFLGVIIHDLETLQWMIDSAARCPGESTMSGRWMVASTYDYGFDKKKDWKNETH